VAATRALELPLASALVVALLATRWIYPQAPRVVTNIVGLLILLPAVLIVRRLASPTLVPAVCAVGGFFLIDRIREACWSMPLLEQWLFLLEMVFGIGLLALAFSSARVRGDDGDPATVWGGSLRGLLAGLIIALACAVVVGALGFMRLARLLGDGVLISSYVALALYAAPRVAQRLVASVLRARPIGQLLMVQQYRDLLQHRLDRVLCGIAVGASAYVTLDRLNLMGSLKDGGGGGSGHAVRSRIAQRLAGGRGGVQAYDLGGASPVVRRALRAPGRRLSAAQPFSRSPQRGLHAGALRFHHMSNASRCSENEGLNSIIGVVGISYFLR
jgi:hypothetical protein